MHGIFISLILYSFCFSAGFSSVMISEMHEFACFLLVKVTSADYNITIHGMMGVDIR